MAPQERPTRRALREREGADADDGEHAAGRRVAAKTAGDKEVIDTVKARLTSLDFANVLLRTAADYRRVIAIFVA